MGELLRKCTVLVGNVAGLAAGGIDAIGELVGHPAGDRHARALLGVVKREKRDCTYYPKPALTLDADES